MVDERVRAWEAKAWEKRKLSRRGEGGAPELVTSTVGHAVIPITRCRSHFVYRVKVQAVVDEGARVDGTAPSTGGARPARRVHEQIERGVRRRRRRPI